MGIIILPFLFGALIAGIWSLKKVLRLRSNNEIGSNELFWGFLLSVGLFIAISVSYYLEKRTWALSAAFRIPFVLVFLPFVIHLIIRNNPAPRIKYISKIVLISVCCSVILGILFYKVVFNLPDYLGIETYH